MCNQRDKGRSADAQIERLGDAISDESWRRRKRQTICYHHQQRGGQKNNMIVWATTMTIRRIFICSCGSIPPGITARHPNALPFRRLLFCDRHPSALQASSKASNARNRRGKLRIMVVHLKKLLHCLFYIHTTLAMVYGTRDPELRQTSTEYRTLLRSTMEDDELTRLN
jgi:hypothetical protein